MERRLAVILAADVVGYSRLMEADEEATVSTLGTCREIIGGLVASHHGRVFGGAGDSVIVEFASPIEAGRCAGDILRELKAHNVELPEDRRRRFRIGVNRVEGIVEGDNVLGDGVNSLLAAGFGTFPNTTFSQNNGVIQLTGVASRHVGIFISAFLVL